MSHNDLATQASTLGDRSHQKRELAAISVEMTVRQIMSSDILAGGLGIHRHHTLSSMSAAVLNQNRSAAEIIYRRTDQIQKVINFLMTNYIDSEQANYRKGGLLGLAGVIMALTTKRNTLTYEGITFLNQVIPIIQKCLDDKDASVRYYANETLFNVIKVARYHIILFFDLIFNQIQILCDDEDELVRESNKCVNRLLQDVACNYDHFKIKSFINILQSLIRSKSQRVRILALDWIIALDAEPDIYFLVYLHHFINPLFALVIDHRMYDINPRTHHARHKRKLPKDTQLTQQIMADFLAEISEYLQRDVTDIHPSESFDIQRIVMNLVEIIMSDNEKLQAMLTNDMYQREIAPNNTTEGDEETTKNEDDSSSDLQIEAILEYKHKKEGEESLTASYSFGSHSNTNYGFAIGSKEVMKEVGNATQKTVALTWLDTFITFGGERLKKLYASILRAILFAMNDKRIQKTASLLNEHLMILVLCESHEYEHVDRVDNDRDLENDFVSDMIAELKEDDGINLNKYDLFDISLVLDILIAGINGDGIHSRIASLKWISSLLFDLPFVHIPNDKLLKVCFERLCDPIQNDNDEIMTNMTLQVLARLSCHSEIFVELLTNLLSLFYKNQKVLHNKGKLIITTLCQLLDCKKIYSLLANLILKNHSKKKRFVRNMVRLLNLILLTTKELYPLREIIKHNINYDSDSNIFLILYKTWCCSPISLLSLCLLAQRYDLGLMLVNQFKKDIFVHKSVQFLLEIDELIHLLESPIFLHLRLQLLCLDLDGIWFQLFQIVNGLLTLLPNSDGFNQFRMRIQMISLYKRLFHSLATKSNNAELINDKSLNNAMYYHSFKNKNKNNNEKDKLFQLYLDTQTRMHSAL